jgi:hypothetical protein
MLFSSQSIRQARANAAEQSYQDYLRLTQSVRAAAMAARRAASAAFWAQVSGTLRAAGAWVTGQHASVRLGAGQHIHHTGA